MAQRFFLLFFAAALTLCFTNNAQACVFIGGKEPPCSAYWKADVVFTGVVQETTIIKRGSGEIFDHVLIRFTVLQSHRGMKDEHIEVTTITGTECDTKFQVGEKWLVYGVRSPQSGKLVVSSRTSHYEYAAEDLAYIRNAVEGTAESAIYGAVYQYSSTPWKGIRIEIEGEGKKYKVETDKDGRFQVPLLKQGKYSIKGIFPARTDITGVYGSRFPDRIERSGKGTVAEYIEEILLGRCTYLEFITYPPK